MVGVHLELDAQYTVGGSGKTTLYYKFLQSQGIHFINADLIAKEMAPNQPEAMSYEAAQIAEQIRFGFLREGISFCFETVFPILRNCSLCSRPARWATKS